MLTPYARITGEADRLGLHSEVDSIDNNMLRLAQVAPVGLNWQQYVQDIYRQLFMLKSQVTQMQQQSQASSNRKPVPSLQEQTGVQVDTQAGNPATNSYNLNGQSQNFDITQ